jgi:microcystin-dependent protein
MTGPHKIVDGSVGSPAIQFATDSTTGVYKTASGFGIAVGGTKVAEFVPGGIKGARFLGELIYYTGLTAQSLTVFPYGQTLSRTTYADLWAFAQTEISGGNTFYNNGDGSTTFGIGDCRGRVAAGKDDMGGTAAGRVTTANSGFDGTVIGAAGGIAGELITQSTLPNYNLLVNVTQPTFTSDAPKITSTTSQIVGTGGQGPFTLIIGTGTSTTSLATAVGVTVGLNGGGNAYRKMQPTMVCNFLLFAGA